MVERIAVALKVDVSQLWIDEPELTQQESRLLGAFRQLDEEHRARVLVTVIDLAGDEEAKIRGGVQAVQARRRSAKGTG